MTVNPETIFGRMLEITSIVICQIVTVQTCRSVMTPMRWLAGEKPNLFQR